jgi:hypothetical protein
MFLYGMVKNSGKGSNNSFLSFGVRDWKPETRNFKLKTRNFCTFARKKITHLTNVKHHIISQRRAGRGGTELSGTIACNSGGRVGQNPRTHTPHCVYAGARY